MKEPPGKLLLRCHKSPVPMSQGVWGLINSSYLGISNRRLFQTLISCFNFFLELGPNHSLVCHVLNLHSDKEIKIVLSENLSISLNRNTPRRAVMLDVPAYLAGFMLLCTLVFPRIAAIVGLTYTQGHPPLMSPTD